MNRVTGYIIEYKSPSFNLTVFIDVNGIKILDPTPTALNALKIRVNTDALKEDLLKIVMGSVLFFISREEET
jgi:hypothetical protein